ncbi:MAG TPA: hypothetical protein VK563_20385 [Puia sp.]|nr:hypothetical protein [Puia sp.]
MTKDIRYERVGQLIKDGRIICFREIFTLLPKTIMAGDLWMNNNRFDKLKKNVTLFRIKDLFRMAFLLEIDEMLILTIIYNQYMADKVEKAKRI